MNQQIELIIQKSQQNLQSHNAKSLFQNLIQSDQYVGELYSINYETARVQIHDHERQKVGGIPSLSFLIATRINPDSDDIDFKTEDASIILLRVMDAAQLPNSAEAERIRVETAQRVSGETDKHWDQEAMDAKTRVYLGFAGVQCRIIGTFYLEAQDDSNPESLLSLKFGSDISNYYPNRGLKVYKPNDKALETIVNYTDPTTLQDHQEQYHSTARVKLGYIRYASTNRKYQKVDDVSVHIYPADLLAQKSALFGMTRTGKSNTTKIIAKAVYELRHPNLANSDDQPLRIGQIIFDPNGEYANENVQDKDRKDNPNALKNVWKINPQMQEEHKKDEVVTYGIMKHPDDPDRQLMLINFYDEAMLQTGKDLINLTLADQSAQYFKNFCQVSFEKPEKSSFENEGEYYSELTRYTRRVLVYRTILHKAGFEPPVTLKNANLKAGNKSLFSKKLLEKMQSVEDKDKRKEGLVKAAAETLSKPSVRWDSLHATFEGLFYFLQTDEYNTFNTDYIRDSTTGEGWADADLERLLEMFKYSKGTNLIGKLTVQHSNSANTDFAEDIYEDLVKGKLVIVDQSSGEPEINQEAADRIMWTIFRKNQTLFREGKKPTDILIYIEEAHNLLPSGSDLDLKNVWVRTAKEGAKYRLGIVYATQEVSSIQKNILKNTANWFIGHLNNTDETKELKKFYDFEDFEKSIRRAQDKGFLRVKTLSNYFVIPVQVKKFDVTE
ncbi:hypothetical protein U27_06654 [Candidatus Vecturithrix granuli]|uniref:Helicase HerA central domain-containing protein n=1 Tax=Vecturithrix granuli TaxID=1499967 RepID=A0A081C514_VECG1|nr:hypothetical protein U27_06654 [Candidatus Vecturithrix granuli]